MAQGGGTDVGASLAQSSSSGATQSGALDTGGTSQIGSTIYGPGSLIIPTASGFGSSVGGINPLIIVGLAIAAVVAFFAFKK
jgi:hypothetical protein